MKNFYLGLQYDYNNHIILKKIINKLYYQLT